MMYDPEFNSARFAWRSVTSVFTNQANIEVIKQIIDSSKLWVTD